MAKRNVLPEVFGTDGAEMAWAAGFFDGEGTAYAYRPEAKARRASLTIAQVDRFVLDRFQRAVGVGKVYGPYGPYAGNRKPHFQWKSATSADTAAVLRALSPWLSPIKKQQIQKAVSSVA